MPRVYLAMGAVHRFVSTAFPEWQKANPGKSCPEGVEDLAALLARRRSIPGGGLIGSWWTGAPSGARGVVGGCHSGEMEGRHPDDVKSWDSIDD
jgi:hypothetical protein